MEFNKAMIKKKKVILETKVVNSISVGVSFYQLEWNVSVSKCFDVLFRDCIVHIYIYMYIILKFKIFLNSQD